MCSSAGRQDGVTGRTQSGILCVCVVCVYGGVWVGELLLSIVYVYAGWLSWLGVDVLKRSEKSGISGVSAVMYMLRCGSVCVV